MEFEPNWLHLLRPGATDCGLDFTDFDPAERSGALIASFSLLTAEAATLFTSETSLFEPAFTDFTNSEGTAMLCYSDTAFVDMNFSLVADIIFLTPTSLAFWKFAAPIELVA